MKNFGDTIRELRVAQSLRVWEVAGKIGISPAYLNRIERGKEDRPKPEIIKALAKELAADPDILLRLPSSAAEDVLNFLNDQPKVMEILKFIKEASLTPGQTIRLLEAAKAINNQSNDHCPQASSFPAA